MYRRSRSACIWWMRTPVSSSAWSSRVSTTTTASPFALGITMSAPGVMCWRTTSGWTCLSETALSAMWLGHLPARRRWDSRGAAHQPRFPGADELFDGVLPGWSVVAVGQPIHDAFTDNALGFAGHEHADMTSTQTDLGI